MSTKRYEGLSGTDKAAALLMTLPPEHSASVVRCLSTEQVERVTKKMLRSDQLTAEVQDSILKEAHEYVTAERYIATGGVEYARSLLAKALGAERAEELINRLVATIEAQPFHYLNDVEPAKWLGMSTIWIERDDPYAPGALPIQDPWAADARIARPMRVWRKNR